MDIIVVAVATDAPVFLTHSLDKTIPIVGRETLLIHIGNRIQ